MQDSSFFNIQRKGGMVRVTFVRDPTGVQEFDTFIDALTNLYAKKKKFTLLFDTSKFGDVPEEYRSRVGAWIDNNRENAKMYLEKSAVLIGNPLLRNVIKLICMVHKPASPVKFCSTLRECVVYLGWMEKKDT